LEFGAPTDLAMKAQRVLASGQIGKNIPRP
jgi:hypothetical protein